MTRLEELRGLVDGAAAEDLPDIIGALEAASVRARVRAFAAPATRAATPALGLVPLTKEWAAAHGYQFETAQKLARSGRLRGAVPAPSSGKGQRKRWLVPATIAPAVIG